MYTFSENKVKLLLMQKEFNSLKKLFAGKGRYLDITTLFFDNKELYLHNNNCILKACGVRSKNGYSSSYVELSSLTKKEDGGVSCCQVHRYKPSPKEGLAIVKNANTLYDIFGGHLATTVSGDLSKVVTTYTYRFKVTGISNEYCFDVISSRKDNKTYTLDILNSTANTPILVKELCDKNDIKHTFFPKNEYQLAASELQLRG